MRLKALANIKAAKTRLSAGDIFELGDVAGQALVKSALAEETKDAVTVHVVHSIGTAVIKSGQPITRKSKPSKKSKE